MLKINFENLNKKKFSKFINDRQTDGQRNAQTNNSCYETKHMAPFNFKYFVFQFNIYENFRKKKTKSKILQIQMYWIVKINFVFTWSSSTFQIKHKFIGNFYFNIILIFSTRYAKDHRKYLIKNQIFFPYNIFPKKFQFFWNFSWAKILTL